MKGIRKILLCFLLALTIPTSLFPQKKFTVVIDAGHGGKDPGTNRRGVKEKNITLSIAKELGRSISSSCKDVKVIYTRKSDVFIPLDTRSRIANKANANLFISIHVNSAPNSEVTGAETYILGLHRSKENLEVAKRENEVIVMEDNYSKKYEGFDPKDPESYILFEFMTDTYLEQSLKLADFLQYNLSNRARRDNRGVRQAGFLVLRETAMPSVLIEVGYITNASERSFMQSSRGVKELSNAILNGFLKYKYEFDKRSNKNSSDKQTKDKSIAKKTDKKNGELIYRIQILTSNKKIRFTSDKQKKLKELTYYKEGNLYKYTCNPTNDFNEAQKTLRELRKIYKGAFIIRLKNDQRIKR